MLTLVQALNRLPKIFIAALGRRWNLGMDTSRPKSVLIERVHTALLDPARLQATLARLTPAESAGFVNSEWRMENLERKRQADRNNILHS